jgi:hypothetical protein
MAIHSHGYVPEQDQSERRKSEFKTFSENLDLLLDKQQEILSCPEFFFTPLAFAWCSWPYIGGSGPLCLGYLMLGWQDGIFTEPCPSCSGKVLVTFFGGSPLSGSNGWSGICSGCRKHLTGKDTVHKPFSDRVKFVLSLRKSYPEGESTWEEYDGLVFSWGGSGLKPARKKRLVWTEFWKPVNLAVLVTELTEGNSRERFTLAPLTVPGALSFVFSNKHGDSVHLEIKKDERD